jgi:2'-5' RNA ligase
MAYAITLRLSAEAASRVGAMWHELAARGVSDDQVRLGYPPHLTLAVVPDDSATDRLLAAARDAAGKWRPLPVTLASLGWFPGLPAALFLAPVPTAELLAAHAELLAWLADMEVDPHYRSGHWVPHVTLAGELTDPAPAVASIAPASLPIEVILHTIEVVRFPPVHVLASHRLTSDTPAQN